MDELEISGKRYISTRRAAKEHKYSSDYIGQLIRGKKVVGQKVGRSWYVDEVSLAEYFGKEQAGEKQKSQIAVKTVTSREVEAVPTPVRAPVVEAKPIEKKEEEIAITIAEIEPVTKVPTKKITTPVVFDNEVTHVKLHTEPRTETSEERAYRVPINVKEKKGLVYLSDDEPLLPMLDGTTRQTVNKNISVTSPVPSSSSTMYEDEYQSTKIPRPYSQKNSVAIKTFALLSVGILVIVAVAGISTSVTASMRFEEGQGVKTQLSL